MIDAIGIEGRGAPLDAVDDVAFIQQEPGQMGSVLSGHAGDQRNLLDQSDVSRKSSSRGPLREVVIKEADSANVAASWRL